MKAPEAFPGRAILVALTVWLLVQAGTGWLLAAYFRPQPDEALASLHEVQYLVNGGAMVRSMHHYGASLLVSAAFLYVGYLLLRGGYAWRFLFAWWSALLLVACIGALGFTGYLLPWDNHAYWSMHVGVELTGLLPIIGDALATLLRGGKEYGPDTLRRLFTLHAMVLPTFVAAVLLWHWHVPAAPVAETPEEKE